MYDLFVENIADNTFAIREFSKRTSTNSVTLRAWENRYGLKFHISKMPSGHRRYDASSVELLARVKQFINNGVSLKNMCSLLQTENEIIFAVERNGETSIWADYINQILHATSNFSLDLLDETYSELLSLYNIDILQVNVFLPLIKLYRMRMLKDFNHNTSEQRFLSRYVRNRIGGYLQEKISSSQGPMLVFGGLGFTACDLHLLMYSIYAINHGFRITTLGLGNSIEELVYVYRKIDADAIVVFGEPKKSDKKYCFGISDKILFSHYDVSIETVNTIGDDFESSLTFLKKAINKR